MITRLSCSTGFHRRPNRTWIAGSVAFSLVLLSGMAWVIFALQPFGEREWPFASVAGIAILFVAGPALRAAFPRSAWRPTRRSAPWSLRPVRRMLIGGLTCWLGLIVWSSLTIGGVTPPPPSDPCAIRVVTWNILHGRDHGAPWTRYGWPARKRALKAALATTQPDILCVQEALAEQVDALAAMLPHHEHAGVGRDDGKAAGEYCAIFYDSDRFAEVGGGTFWLEEPTDLPPSHLRLGPKRICTWVRLFEQTSGRFLRVYNTHLYLTEKARRRAVPVILAKIADGDPTDALVVTGDFNAPADAPSRLLFEKSGLVSTAEAAGKPPKAPTYHFYGIRLRNLDEIFCSRDCLVGDRIVLDVKPGNTYPSDHFGIMADLTLAPPNTTNQR